jgi:hypothetical protein
MTLKGHLKRIERALRGTLDGFVLEDGTRYYFDPTETYKEMFLHAYDLQLGDAEKWPEPPEVYRKIAEAKDPAAVLERFRPENPQSALFDPAALFDTDALVNERRLVLLTHARVEDLSE